jgi:hypothetical protein
MKVNKILYYLSGSYRQWADRQNRYEVSGTMLAEGASLEQIRSKLGIEKIDDCDDAFWH